MSDTAEPDHVPQALQPLIDASLDRVRTHRRHELGQDNRNAIYDVLCATPRGRIACQWLTVLAAHRAQPVYLGALFASRHAENNRVLCLFDAMVGLAEEFITGTKTLEDYNREVERGETEEYYHSILFAAADDLPGYVWLATLAAYHAAEEVLRRPLEAIITSSDTWPDPRLTGSGGGSDDVAVDAAYAYALMTSHEDYNAGRLLEFWEWWLGEAIPRAWDIAIETQRYHQEVGFPSSGSRYAPSYPP